MLTKQERYACSETYEDVEKLICSLAWTWVRRYGGDVEELIADGNSHFLRAYMAPTYDPTKSKFSFWVRNVVWRGWCSDVARNRRHEQLPATLTAREPRKMEWLEDLSEEASTVVKIVLDMPDPVADELDKHGDDPSPSVIRRAVKNYLASLGWAAHKIAAAFEEIGKSL